MGVADLADYPWDAVAPYAARARAHPDGIVDLSIGSPVDPTPPVVARRAAQPRPTRTPTRRRSARPRCARRSPTGTRRRRGVPGARPRPTCCRRSARRSSSRSCRCCSDLGPGDVVVHPRAAYPTYEVGARLVGATPVAADDPASGPTAPGWCGSTRPATPTGGCWMPPPCAPRSPRARELGAVLASDECYAELGWERPWDAEPIPSVLDPRVTDGDLRGILSVYSLSKQSNLAGYRAAFLAGDPEIVARLVTARKHLGLMLPAPRAGGDGRRARRRRARRRAEGALPRAARRCSSPRSRPPASASTRSEAGLYLWATEGRDAWESIGAARRPRHPGRARATSTARTSRSTCGCR